MLAAATVFISTAVAQRLLFIGNVRKCRIVIAKERRDLLDDPGDMGALGEIILLRQYLLLGDSAFWRSFFDELRAKPSLLTSKDLEPNGRQIIERSLAEMLPYTVDDFASDNVALEEKSPQWDSILILHVTTAGDIVLQFTLGFSESRV